MLDFNDYSRKNQEKTYLEAVREAIEKLADRVSIIPIGPDKKALVPWREYQNRCATIAEIHEWWRRYPDANVAIVTGEISDLVVADCDTPEAREGLASYLVGASPWEAKTPRGYHLYFKFRPGLVNRAAILPGVDIRTTGGYAVAPPSVNADGVPYEWIKGGDFSVSEPGPMPDALFNLLAPKERPKQEAPPNDGPGPDNAYGRAALADECRKVAEAPETTRNNTLNRAALKLGHYVGGGILSYADVENALLNAALACGLLERDARATIKSGLDAGIQEPRTPPNNDKHSSHGGERKEPPKADEWPEPEPLPDTLRPVEKFQYALLPSGLRGWVADISERMQCPPDFVGVGAMVVLGSVIGRRCTIYPKRYDDFQVIPNLWGVMIGPPAAMKSPAGDEVMKPVKRLEIDAKKEFEEADKNYQASATRAKIEMDIAKEQAKKDLKAGKPLAEIDRMFSGIDDAIGDAPTRPRFYVSDATIEKLGVVMGENPGGVLLYRDELFGWFKNLAREDRANDRAFYLECWSGMGSYPFDRIGRGTIDVNPLSLSVWGGIQPGRMASVIRGAVKGGVDDDGLAYRFGMMVYPDTSKNFKIVDRWPDKEAKALAFDVFKRLAALPVPGPDQGIPAMRFDDAAQELFFTWWTELEIELRSGELHPAIEKHLTKYRKLIPALALICHLAEDDDVMIPKPGHEETHGVIPLEPLQKALGWYEYLRSHAERVYGLALAGNMAAAKSLLQKLISGKLPSPFTKREIKKKCWAGLSEDEDISLAINTLVDYGYLAKITPDASPVGGRPSVQYYLNPKAAR